MFWIFCDRIVQQSIDVKRESNVWKSRPMCLLFAGNDTVPISLWRGAGMCRPTCYQASCRLPLYIMVSSSVSYSAL